MPWGNKDIAQPAVIAAKSPAQSTRHGTSRDVLGSPQLECQSDGATTEPPRASKKLGRAAVHPLSVDPAGSGVPPVHPGYTVSSQSPLRGVYPASPCFVHGSPSTQPTGPSASERPSVAVCATLAQPDQRAVSTCAPSAPAPLLFPALSSARNPVVASFLSGQHVTFFCLRATQLHS